MALVNSGAVERGSFLRSLLTYFGPALIVSVAYIDPGNYGTDISGGASFGYSMLWVVWLAGVMAMLLQYLSGKIGIATGHSLPELVRLHLKRRIYILPYWLASEVAVAMTDLAEFLGTVIALYLLFGIPLLYGTFISVLDVVLILGLTGGRMRRLEQMFVLFVSIIGFGYVYEIFIVRPDPMPLIMGSIIPNLGSEARLLVAVGVIGATVMPHALFLHSSLSNDKVTDTRVEQKLRVLQLHRAESIIMFTFAGVVNVAIMAMAAAAFHTHGQEVGTIEGAYRTLTPIFGPAAAVVFGITLLFSGLSSSTTGTLAGQAIMEGMLDKRINVWLRRIVTRVVNTIPTTVAILSGMDPLMMLVYSQVFLSLMLPLPLLPLWKFTSDKKLMGALVNKRITTILAGLFIVLILSLNALLLYFTLGGKT
ncbi:Nramp family divalent metal transporter [Candidatus Bathyarchaeota archaeon]|jgi:manganese transport protein|nr:Nramp family divalent metal transporter [Candidatus Bathyarchaeota archaeon]